MIQKTVLTVILSCTLLFLSACVNNNSAIPGAGEKTAPKKAPDFSIKEIHTKDGHIIKYEGKNGSGFVRSYKDGKKDGITALYNHGLLWGERSYKNGVLDGWSIDYHVPTKEVYYVNGKEHGVLKEWCDETKEHLKRREHYTYGQLDGLNEEWRCMGKHYLMHSIEYKNGKKDGLCNIYNAGYYGDGGLDRSIRYKNGKKDGVSKIYHNNGKLCCLDTYKNGIREGESKNWDHTGKLTKETVYKNGREFDMHGNFITKIKVKSQ